MVDDRALSPEVERFVVDCIPSVVHLEALLLLRSHASQELSLEEVATLLYVDAQSATKAMADLVASRLVSALSPRGPFRFAPEVDRGAPVEALARAHRTKLVPLTRFIHESAARRSIRDFADAFRFRKE